MYQLLKIFSKDWWNGSRFSNPLKRNTYVTGCTMSSLGSSLGSKIVNSKVRSVFTVHEANA